MIQTSRLLHMWRRDVDFLIAPPDKHSNHYNRQAVVNVLLLGALVLTSATFLVLVLRFVVMHLPYLPRIGVMAGVLTLMLSLYGLSRRGHYRIAAYGLLVIYFLCGIGVLAVWSINTPIGVLLLALCVIFSGSALGARSSLYTFLIVTGALLILVVLIRSGAIQPDVSWLHKPPSPGDITAVIIVFGNVALVSWLFNRSMENSLERVQRSEQALRHQKKFLQVKVEERTRQVQAAHLERMQEQHRFAELGHMSVALLHDMANYLTVLSMDIEDLKQTRQDRSAGLQRIQQSIRHLNNLIDRTRRQIKGEDSVVRFNVADEIDQVMKLLEYKASAGRIKLEWQQTSNRPELTYKGSLNHFWQIILNIISNALDAYEGMKNIQERRVLVATNQTETGIAIHITDFGKGITKAKQAKIFEPFFSTKKNGTGMGLAIAKRMIEKDFGGSISVTSKPKNSTTFTIILPKHDKKHRNRA